MVTDDDGASPRPRRRDLRAARTAAAKPAGAAPESAGAAHTRPLAALFSATVDGERPAADPTPTILVVCTGNICRSPLAELMLREALCPLGVRVYSAGTSALTGHGMPREAKRVAQDLGLAARDAAAHRARTLTDAMITGADLTLTMTVDHRTDILARVPSALRRVFTVREFAALAADLAPASRTDVAASSRARLAAIVSRVADRRGGPSGSTFDVVDPYGRGPEAYDECALQLAPAIDGVVRAVRPALMMREPGRVGE